MLWAQSASWILDCLFGLDYSRQRYNLRINCSGRITIKYMKATMQTLRPKSRLISCYITFYIIRNAPVKSTIAMYNQSQSFFLLFSIYFKHLVLSYFAKNKCILRINFIPLCKSMQFYTRFQFSTSFNYPSICILHFFHCRFQMQPFEVT